MKLSANSAKELLELPHSRAMILRGDMTEPVEAEIITVDLIRNRELFGLPNVDLYEAGQAGHKAGGQTGFINYIRNALDDPRGELVAQRMGAVSYDYYKQIHLSVEALRQIAGLAKEPAGDSPVPSLKDLKVRIKSVKSTQKITKAMKMVAAAKLRRAREAAEAARPYALAMEGMVSRLAAGSEGQTNLPELLVGTGKEKTELLVVVTADRGLSGAFNSSVVRAAKKRIRELEAQGKTVKIYTIGRKGRDWLGDYKSNLVGSRTDLAKNSNYNFADSIAQEIFASIDANNIDRITMIYNKFKSVIAQIVTFQQLMPLQVTGSEASGAVYDYEPSEEEILADLLPRNFAMQIFSALLENNAGFYGAQMNAMENATKNAGEMIKKLTLKYNRTRQANITKELIEIISGAEAI